MKKKLVGVMLSTVVLSSALAGCGLSAPASTETAPAAEAVEEAAAEAEEVVEEVAAEAEEVVEEGAAEAEEVVEEAAAAAGEYTVNEAAAADPVVELTMAELNPIEDTICGMTDLKFKEAVEAISGGSIKIDLQGSGVLGVEADILDGMIGGTGTVDICRIGANSLNNYGISKGILTSLPYTFASREHFWAVMNSPIGQELLDEPEELGIGVKGLFFGEEGTRNFFTVESKPVETPEDMKNLKIRSSADPVMSGMISNLGATPSPVAFSEIYPSMQNGTIDGAEQPVANYRSNSFQEVGPNLTLDGHTLGVIEVIMTSSAFDTKLTENQQAVILEASKIAADYCAEVSAEKEAEVIQQLKDEGINVIEIEDKTAWREACSPIVQEYLTGDLGDLYQQIVGMAE
ncbi:MAG: TRAP transporter substrate-binding protein [Lachnospiraceae bacterium]|nr:TRAP transporter substrate-binding protein [Lachnospiraceae bacterium]